MSFRERNSLPSIVGFVIIPYEIVNCAKAEYLIRDFGMLFGIEVLADGDDLTKRKLNVAGTIPLTVGLRLRTSR